MTKIDIKKIFDLGIFSVEFKNFDSLWMADFIAESEDGDIILFLIKDEQEEEYVEIIAKIIFSNPNTRFEYGEELAHKRINHKLFSLSCQTYCYPCSSYDEIRELVSGFINLPENILDIKEADNDFLCKALTYFSYVFSSYNPSKE